MFCGRFSFQQRCLPVVRTMCTATATRATKKVKGNRPIIVSQKARNAALDKQSEESKLSWRIVGATILHRYPVITEDPKPWEEAMWELQEKTDAMRREHLMDNIKGTEAQLIPDMDPTYEEILESMPFKPASRVTEADIANDRHSTDRRLQNSLYLIVKRNREKNAWQFPQGKILAEETLRATGERVIDRAVGVTNRWFVSNAPVGHFSYNYAPAMQQQRENFGAKVFYYRAQLLAGNVKLQTKLYTDYAWIARDEVKEYFDPETSEFLTALLPN